MLNQNLLLVSVLMFVIHTHYYNDKIRQTDGQKTVIIIIKQDYKRIYFLLLYLMQELQDAIKLIIHDKTKFSCMQTTYVTNKHFDLNSFIY